VVTLALGIGANAAVFSVVNGILLRPLPYRDANKLVLLWGNFLKLNIERLPAKAAEYHDYSQQAKSFDAVAAFESQDVNLTSNDQAERIRASHVTPNLFSLLGVQPSSGRAFTNDESQTGRDNAVVLSHPFSQQHFGNDADALGKTITLEDRSYRVIGVMPAGFEFPYPNLPSAHPASVWIPLVVNAEQIAQRRGPYYLNVIARLKDGTSVEQARSEMSAIARRFEQEQRGYRGPNGEDGGWRITVAPLLDEIVGNTRRPLVILFGAVLVVLLIAASNVANLLLMRADKRQHELAIRKALGASRWQIAQQLLIESLMLTTLGGAVGLWFAHLGVDFLKTLNPANLPRVDEVAIDARVLVFTALIAILTGIVFGMASVAHLRQIDPQTSLKTSVAAQGSGRRYWSSALVIAEVALSLLLLVGSGLLVNSLRRVLQVKPAIATDELTTAEIDLSASRYREPAQVSAFFQELIQRLESSPGIQSVSFGTSQPLSGTARNDPFAIEGRRLDPANLTTAGWQLAGAHYFRTLGIPLVRGRDLTEADMSPSAPVIGVINEKMAARYWPNEDPIGRRISLGLPRPDNPWITIVGIAKDLPYRNTEATPEPDWYLSRTNGPQLNRYLFVRSAADREAIAHEIRSAVAAVDARQPVTDIETMNQIIAATVAPRRFNTFLLGAFALLALALATIGIYSVISCSVTLRRQEIGIRMALGAQRHDVLSMVIRQGMSLTIIGIALGLAAAFALTRLMASMLFDVKPNDPATFFSLALLVSLVALVACYLPARRATKVDPLVALRYE
jgi:putative ABC transport system permease protein